MKTIEARNAHCLFKYDLDRLDFSARLKASFNTVCFTEAPLTQIKRLIAKVADRKIELEPYGLVFDKNFLLRRGANPAIYVNANGTRLRDYLLKEFRIQFQRTRTLAGLKQNQQDYYRAIVHYYSLINIIRPDYDFTWEREWRLNGDLPFRYSNIVAIMAENPSSFESACENRLSKAKFRYIQMLPIVSPAWEYQDIVEQMSVKIWNNALPKGQ